MLGAKNTVLLALLVLVLLFSSCLDTGSNMTVETTVSIATLTPIPENISTSMPLPAETKASPTAFPSIKTQCVGGPNGTQDFDLRGVVVLEKAAKVDSFEFGLFLLNLENRSTIKGVDEGLSAQVSPERKYVAYEYINGDEGFLVVLDGNGKRISDFPFRIDGKAQSFFNWQNAERLRTIEQQQAWKIYIQLLNPFVQKSVPLRTNWKGVYAPKNPFSDKLVQWKFDQQATNISYVYGANILYDPSLTRVLYPKDNGVVSLTNAEDETELASAQFEDWGRLPSWSPDGQYLTIVNREGSTDEFYLISRDGNAFQKITDFATEFDLVYVSEYAWSPDGKQIAFWLNTESMERELGKQAELALLDITTKQVTRLCIQGISVPAVEPWTMNHPEPIWSPDGRYIMITQWDDPVDPKKYRVLILDPVTGKVTTISENTAPIGWMISEP